MRRTSGWGTMVRWAGLTVGALALLGGCAKSKPEKKADRTLDHRAGIPVLPRGEVVLATAKGERYLLEIHARVPINQAVAFYRTQLARENWTELRVQQVESGLWGLACRRGMFELTGRIKQLKQGVVSIGFERTVRRPTESWKPPVHKDVPVLSARVQWEDRVFQLPDNRVELRGRSAHAPAVLQAAVRAELKTTGWSVPAARPGGAVVATRSVTRQVTADQRKAVTLELQRAGWTVELDKDQRTLRGTRRLSYLFEAVGSGSTVRLQLPYDELLAGTAPAARPGPPADARARPRPAVDSNLVALPADLVLWPTKEPVFGVKQSEDLHSFSLSRACTAAEKLLADVVRRLKKRRWRPLGGVRQPTVTTGGGDTHSATLTKGKRAVVVIVTPEAQGCAVQLTVLRQAKP